MKRILLDTNAYSLYAAKDKLIAEAVEKARSVALSSVTLGELYAGFLGGDRYDKNVKILDNFLRDNKVLLVNVNLRTSKIYGHVYYQLHKRGTPIPSNDIWIAACAIESGSIIVTYDTHFLKIPILKVWKELR